MCRIILAVLLFLGFASQALGANYCVAIDSEQRMYWHPQLFDIRACWTADRKSYCGEWLRLDVTPPNNATIRSQTYCVDPTTPGHIVMSHFEVRYVASLVPGAKLTVWPLRTFEQWPSGPLPEAWQLSQGRYHFKKDHTRTLIIMRGKHPNNPR
jgi:hypothetical protein